MLSDRPRFTLVSLLFLLSSFFPAFAGARSHAVPNGVRHRLAPVDEARLRAEDRARAPGLPFRVGLERTVSLQPGSAGVWAATDGGGRVWSLEVESPGAHWLVLGFDLFRLPPRAELRVTDRDRATVRGPYGSREVRPHGQLWLPPVPGDLARIELSWPADTPKPGQALRLSSISHGYRKLDRIDSARDGAAAPTDGVSGSCNIDVTCRSDEAFDRARRGAVQLIVRGSAVCSASLINTTADDCRPYVLTAAHCVSTPADAASTILRFNYEKPSCDAGVPPTTQFVNGAILRASWSLGDFSLLELDAPIPAGFEAHFTGWNRSPWGADETWSIHHPSGDVKKISYNADPLVAGQATGWGPTHWRVTDWEQGTTEGGSSGAPLLDAAGRILGQLHGGIASCSDREWDEYGKLAAGWTGGGTPETRLAGWLDPLGSDALLQPGRDHAECLDPAPRLALTDAILTASGDGVEVTVSLGNDGLLTATGVLADAATGAPGVELLQGRLAWPDIVPGTVETSSDPQLQLELSGASCGQHVPLELELDAAEISAKTVWLDLRVGSPQTELVLVEDLESDLVGWQSGGDWAALAGAGLDGSTGWHVDSTDSETQSTLILELAEPLPTDAVLRFRQRHDLEHGADGGLMQYTVDRGATWNDVSSRIVTGGYNGSILPNASSTLAGRAVWTGDSGGWVEVTVDLTDLEGEFLGLLWRFASDDDHADGGWTLDDLTLERSTWECQTDPRSGRRLEDGRRRSRELRDAARH